MFYYVYVLRSVKDKKLYIGFTDNLRRRFSEHNQGKQKSTKPGGPLELIFYEAYLNKGDALRREKYFKTNPGKRTLKLMLRNFLTEF